MLRSAILARFAGPIAALVAVAAAVVASGLLQTSAADVPGPLTAEPALGSDPRFARVTARPENGAGMERGVYLPALASPGEEIVGSVDEPSSPVYVGTIDGQASNRAASACAAPDSRT